MVYSRKRGKNRYYIRAEDKTDDAEEIPENRVSSGMVLGIISEIGMLALGVIFAIQLIRSAVLSDAVILGFFIFTGVSVVLSFALPRREHKIAGILWGTAVAVMMGLLLVILGVLTGKI